jgi:hypothetical protein
MCSCLWSEASEKKRAEARRGQGQCWGEAGDGAHELLPWTANLGAQKHFDLRAPSREGLQGQKPCARFIFPCLIQFVCVSLFNTVCVCFLVEYSLCVFPC